MAVAGAGVATWLWRSRRRAALAAAAHDDLGRPWDSWQPGEWQPTVAEEAAERESQPLAAEEAAEREWLEEQVAHPLLY